MHARHIRQGDFLDHCPTARVVVAGNKSDVPSSARVVARKEAEAWAAQFGYGYVEVSAKAGLRVAELFACAARQCLRAAGR